MIRRGLRHFPACLALIILTACTPAPTGVRDTSVPMGATTRFDPLRFEGAWQIVASFYPVRAGPLTVTVAPEVVGVSLASNSVPEIVGFYDLGSPGVLIPRTPGAETLVVMWVDEEFQTAALGTPSGSFGAVLNRSATIAPDKGVAVREIFEFYGWDVSRLKRTYK